MERVEPVFLVKDMRALAELSYSLLETLTPTQWQAPTSSSRWCVQDIVAHLLDGNVRRLSFQRDGHASPRLAPEISSHQDLVDFLNGLNDDWTRAAYRMSPGLLIELLRFTDARLLDFFESLDPFASAHFPVAWAGEERSLNWFDIAREYTEKWHHQMQIREAVGRLTPLDAAPFLPTAIDVFLRGLPHHFTDTPFEKGTHLHICLADLEDPGWSLVREQGAWVLYRGGEPKQARLEWKGVTAWKILTKRRPPDESKARFADIAFSGGDVRLLDHFLSTVSMMA